MYLITFLIFVTIQSINIHMYIKKLCVDKISHFVLIKKLHIQIGPYFVMRKLIIRAKSIKMSGGFLCN